VISDLNPGWQVVALHNNLPRKGGQLMDGLDEHVHAGREAAPGEVDGDVGGPRLNAQPGSKTDR
jgi:hypothetical protein